MQKALEANIARESNLHRIRNVNETVIRRLEDKINEADQKQQVT